MNSTSGYIIGINRNEISLAIYNLTAAKTATYNLSGSVTIFSLEFASPHFAKSSYSSMYQAALLFHGSSNYSVNSHNGSYDSFAYFSASTNDPNSSFYQWISASYSGSFFFAIEEVNLLNSNYNTLIYSEIQSMVG
jgi:hypothetical protein